MPAINRQFDTAIDVFHLEDDTGNKRKWEDTASFSTVGALMPAAPEDIALLEGSYSEVKKLYTPQGVDIRKSDKLTIGGVDYQVGGKEDFNRGINQHLELVIYLPN